MTGHYTEATSSHVRLALAKVIINIYKKKMATQHKNAMISAIKEQQMFMSCAKNIKRMELFKSSSAVLSYLLLLILKKLSTKEKCRFKRVRLHGWLRTLQSKWS